MNDWDGFDRILAALPFYEACPELWYAVRVSLVVSMVIRCLYFSIKHFWIEETAISQIKLSKCEIKKRRFSNPQLQVGRLSLTDGSPPALARGHAALTRCLSLTELTPSGEARVLFWLASVDQARGRTCPDELNKAAE